jgi:hypothetical protein
MFPARIRDRESRQKQASAAASGGAIPCSFGNKASIYTYIYTYTLICCIPRAKPERARLLARAASERQARERASGPHGNAAHAASDGDGITGQHRRQYRITDRGRAHQLDFESSSCPTPMPDGRHQYGSFTPLAVPRGPSLSSHPLVLETSCRAPFGLRPALRRHQPLASM